MYFLNWLSRQIVLGVIVTWCGMPSVRAQTIAGIIDTAARPAVFADGVVSTPYSEWATSFMPDGKTVYFSQGGIFWTICYSKMVNGKWVRPKVANISGRWNDTDPFITPDGKRMYFISNRPPAGMPQDKHQPDYHIWFTERLNGDEWGEPHRLDSIINLKGVSNYATSVSKAGDLYFCSRDREGHKGMESYYARWLGDHFDKPQLLALRGTEETQDPFIAPDGSYILFESGPDLYISFKDGDNWAAAQNLGKQVNNGDFNSSPSVSPDGKMLYYSTGRIQGFYKRDPKRSLNYDELEKEMKSNFNSESNILVIPINLPKHNEKI
jgi:Tol biopolymer transport system component